MLAFKGNGLTGTNEAKEFFKLLAGEAVISKRRQVRTVKATDVVELERDTTRTLHEETASVVPVNCFSAVPLSEVTEEAQRNEEEGHREPDEKLTNFQPHRRTSLFEDVSPTDVRC